VLIEDLLRLAHSLASGWGVIVNSSLQHEKSDTMRLKQSPSIENEIQFQLEPS
jgi:hypothetical protein